MPLSVAPCIECRVEQPEWPGRLCYDCLHKARAQPLTYGLSTLAAAIRSAEEVAKSRPRLAATREWRSMIESLRKAYDSAAINALEHSRKGAA